MRRAIVLGLVAACGGGGSSGPDAFSFGEHCTPGGTFDLNGRAAVLGSLNVHVNAGGIVETDTTAEILLAMDVTQNGTNVTVAAQPCQITIPDVPIQGQDQPIHLQVPDATVASVGVVNGTGTLSDPSATCANFDTSQITLVLGALLDPTQQTTAPLPAADANGDFSNYCAPSLDTSCSLAIGTNCACDQESDGFPGATLNAMNVPAVNIDQIYVTLRSNFSLSGQVFSSDKVLGTIDATLETGILSCHKTTGETCTAAEVRAVRVLNPMVTQQPGNPSLFRSARIDAGTTCDQIIAMRDSLFPR